MHWPGSQCISTCCSPFMDIDLIKDGHQGFHIVPPYRSVSWPYRCVVRLDLHLCSFVATVMVSFLAVDWHHQDFQWELSLGLDWVGSMWASWGLLVLWAVEMMVLIVMWELLDPCRVFVFFWEGGAYLRMCLLLCRSADYQLEKL